MGRIHLSLWKNIDFKRRTEQTRTILGFCVKNIEVKFHHSTFLTTLKVFSHRGKWKPSSVWSGNAVMSDSTIEWNAGAHRTPGEPWKPMLSGKKQTKVFMLWLHFCDTTRMTGTPTGGTHGAEVRGLESSCSWVLGQWCKMKLDTQGKATKLMQKHGSNAKSYSKKAPYCIIRNQEDSLLRGPSSCILTMRWPVIFL